VLDRPGLLRKNFIREWTIIVAFSIFQIPHF
jgi:hypothetical protein